MSTPVQLHDAIETQIPYRFRAETIVVLADLKSPAPVIRENAFIRGHAIASQLKAVAADVKTSGLFSDAEPSACSRVADHICAAMDHARQSAPSPYASGTVNDAAQATDSESAQIGDAATGYEKMLDRDRNAWKGVQ
jgi:hypothetical protein